LAHLDRARGGIGDEWGFRLLWVALSPEHAEVWILERMKNRPRLLLSAPESADHALGSKSARVKVPLEQRACRLAGNCSMVAFRTTEVMRPEVISQRITPDPPMLLAPPAWLVAFSLRGWPSPPA